MKNHFECQKIAFLINFSFITQDNGAAYEAGGLEVGQLILEVDGHKVEGKKLKLYILMQNYI